MTENTDISHLLDASLDDLADLPAFEVPPAGAYHATIISLESKTIGTHPAVEVKFKLNETMELNNPADKPVVNGTETSVAYMLDNDFGQGKFKEFLAPLSAHLGITKIRDVLAEAKGMDVVLVTKVRQNKEKTQSYMDVHSIQVV
jgi:hypothetical protein